MKRTICILIFLSISIYNYSQATYTVVSGALECVGPDITSAGIYAALISNNFGTGHFQETNNPKNVYFFNANIRIGNSANSGTASVWNCSNEHIKINATRFEIFGSVLQGNITSGQSADGGSISVTGTSNDTFRLYDTAKFKAYGSAIYAENRIRVDSNCEFVVEDCDFEPEDGVSLSDGWNSSNSFISYDRSRVHHTGAVGIKLYASDNTNSFSLNFTKVEGCQFAFQLGNAINLTPILKDVEINSCLFHTVPNKGNSNVVFVNPDFTTLRASGADNNDITTIAFRYAAKVLDADNLPITDVRCYYEDESGTVVLNNTLTNTLGEVTGLTVYEGETTLQNSTYVGNTKTTKALHSKAYASYFHGLRVEPITISKDISESIILADDIFITEPSKAIVDAYTTIDTSEKFYDSAKAFIVNNYSGESETLVTRKTNTINARDYNVVIDATAAAIFAFDGTTITIRANVFNGNIITANTANVTAINGAVLEGGYIDSTGTNKFVHLDWNENKELNVTFINRDDSSIIPTTGTSPTTEVFKGFFLLPDPAPTAGVSVEITSLIAGGSPLFEFVIPFEDLSFVSLKVLLNDRSTEENQQKMLFFYKKLLVKTEAIKNALSSASNPNVTLTENITNTNSTGGGTRENQEALIRLLKRLLSKVTANRNALSND